MTTKDKKKKKAPSDVGKIAYVTMARFVGKPYHPDGAPLTQEQLDAMVENGVVAPDPKAKVYDKNVQDLYLSALRAIEEWNTALGARGAKKRFRLQVFEVK